MNILGIFFVIILATINVNGDEHAHTVSKIKIIRTI